MQASSWPRSGKAYSRGRSPSRDQHKGRSPARQRRSPSFRPGNNQGSPVNKQASTRVKSSSSESPKRRGPGIFSRGHTSQGQQQNPFPGSRAQQGSEAPQAKQDSKSAPAAQPDALMHHSSTASKATPAQAVGSVLGHKQTLQVSVTQDAQQDVAAAFVAPAPAEAANLGVAPVKTELPAKLTENSPPPNGVAELDVIDITADDTDLSQLSQDDKQLAAPTAAADVIMTEAQPVIIDITAADTAEAFISLDDDEDIQASQAKLTRTVSQEQSLAYAKPPQTQHISTPATTAVIAQPSAAAATERAEQEGVRPGVVAAGQAKETGSANGRPAYAKAAQPVVQPAAAHPQQRPVSAAKGKTAGKGGIQILVATKHKEVQHYLPSICRRPHPCCLNQQSRLKSKIKSCVHCT